MEILKLGINEIAAKIKSGEVSSKLLVEHFFKQCEKFKHKNAVLEFFDDAFSIAEGIDKAIAEGKETRPFAGVPVMIKDNFLFKGKVCSCASNFMKDFVSPYSATVVNKLVDAGFVIIGRTNMDEFAMGGTNETSAFGACLNAHSDDFVAGGSSGGSAVSVACNLTVVALGSDTGGSVRQPSSFNGVVGMKPTYGRVSRYGVTAFASSFDQVGPITSSVRDNAIMLGVIAGHDSFDQMSADCVVPNFADSITGSVDGLVVGVVNQLVEKIKTTTHHKLFEKLLAFLKENGAIIKYVDIKNFEMGLPVYYILSTAEAASNLGRFDGVKYSARSPLAQNIDEVYKLSRTSGWGREVKRRIMLGNYVLSSGYYDAYYNKAKKVRQSLVKNAKEIFSHVDVLVLPTTYGEAFRLGEKTKDAVSMYLEDLFTVFASITGLPSASVPYGKSENILPLGVQIVAGAFNEGCIYNVGDFIEKHFNKEDDNAK